MRTFFGSLSLTVTSTLSLSALLSACSAGETCVPISALDSNCDHVKDSLGVADKTWQVDIAPPDGVFDGQGLDTDGDMIVDAVDTDGDGFADTDENGPLNPGAGGGAGSGGATSSGGAPPATGGSVSATGGTMPGTGGSVNPAGHCLDQTPEYSTGRTISGSSDGVRYAGADTTRNGVSYRFIANGWGPNWQSHEISYEGSRFTVDDFQGSRGSNYEPAGYPSVFCGNYSNSTSGACGLPASISSLSQIDTGLSWSHSGDGTDFNVAYDIWMANGSSFAGYLMLWYRDPPQNQPAGSIKANNVMVGPDRWDVWSGTVNNSPIVNYVRPQGSDLAKLSFDALDYVDHAKTNYNLPGDTVMSVAIGFEIWSGPVTNLSVDDFCVNVK
jgi:hypothetical protein